MKVQIKNNGKVIGEFDDLQCEDSTLMTNKTSVFYSHQLLTKYSVDLEDGERLVFYSADDVDAMLKSAGLI